MWLICRKTKQNKKRLNIYIWPVNRSPIVSTSLVQSAPASNGKEQILQTPRLEPHYLMHFKVIPQTLKCFNHCYLTLIILCPVGWGCRIHWLLLCRGVRPRPNECPGYDTKQSDGEVPAMLEPWGMRSTPSLPSLPGPLWPGVVASDRALSLG